MRYEYPEQEQPIYIWKLGLDGKLTKSVINRYRVNHFSSSTSYLFRAEKSSNIHSLRDSQMDRFVNNRFCSFSDDDKKAIQVIEANLSAKVKKLKDDYESVETILELLRTNI